MLNSVLLASAAKVMLSTAPSQFTLVAKFFSSAEGSKFSFYPLIINEMVIDRDYSANYGDVIDLNMTISPKDYALLQDQGQDLRCIVTITYTDKWGKQIYSPAPIQKQYSVMINDPRDIRKAVPDVHAYTEPSQKISVRLIEDTVYNLRHTKINTIYQTMTVKDAIYALTQAFEIEKLHLIEPDNTHKYDHIEIGSYQGISSAYGYLQSTCGVYQKGINYYLTEGVLYVYPAFETNPTYDKSVIFYQVNTGRYAGNHTFHRIDGSNISIVINSQPHSYDLSIAGSENVGTGFIFNRASRLTDGFTTVDTQTGAQFTEQPSLSVTLANSRTATKDSNNLTHIHATDNPFPAMSELISHQASLMEVQWPNADPFQLDPCHAVTYCFDRNQTMIKKTGMLEKAKYHITKLHQMDSKSLFACGALLTLRLSPNETQVL